MPEEDTGRERKEQGQQGGEVGGRRWRGGRERKELRQRSSDYGVGVAILHGGRG